MQHWQTNRALPGRDRDVQCLGFLLGIAAVWLYAAIRDHAMVQDRIPQSALDWSLGRLPCFSQPRQLSLGLSPRGCSLISTVVALVEIVVLAGGRMAI